MNQNLSAQQFREQHYPSTMPVDALLPHLRDHANGSPLVDEYADAMKAGRWDWDRKYESPISLSGTAHGIEGVNDGTHRTLAAKQAGLTHVPVEWNEVSWAKQPNLRGTSFEDPSSSPAAERIHRLRRGI